MNNRRNEARDRVGGLSSRVSSPVEERAASVNGRRTATDEAQRERPSGNGSDGPRGGAATLADRPLETAARSSPNLATPAVARRARRGVAGWLIAGSFLLVIATAETVTTMVNDRVGLIAYLLLALMLVRQGATTSDRRRALLWGLILVPVIRISSLSLPLTQLPFIYWYAFVGAPVAAAAILTARGIGYSRADLGLTVRLSALSISAQLAMVPIGFALGIVGYLIIRPQPLTGSLTVENVWLPTLVLAFAAGFTEELVFRGVLQRSALRLLGPWGLVYTTTVFATLQVGHGSGALVAYAFAVGLLLAALAQWTGSLLGVMLARASLTITLLLIAPFVDLSLPARLSVPPVQPAIVQPASIVRASASTESRPRLGDDRMRADATYRRT